jgi:hypothetical protein
MQPPGRSARPVVVLLRITPLVLATLPAFAQTWFPARALPDDAAESYSRFLRAMHEPSLSAVAKDDPGAVSYRLLWLRDHDRPVVIRFAARSGGTAWFHRRVTSGNGVTGPGGLRDTGMSFSFKGRTARFLKTVEDTGFWQLVETPTAPATACRSHWVLEGVRQGQYKVVDRCSPDASDPVRIIGERAMRLGSLRPWPKNVY